MLSYSLAGYQCVTNFISKGTSKKIKVMRHIELLSFHILGSFIDILAIPNPQLRPVPAQPATISDSRGQTFNLFNTHSWSLPSQPSIRTPPVQPISDCTQCWCQCKTLSYRGVFDTIEGNCNR